MNTRPRPATWFGAAIFSLGLGLCLLPSNGDEFLSGIIWPEPPLVKPGTGSSPPSDAKVLFDGSSLSHWNGSDGWDVKDGVAIPRSGGIETKEAFGDCQLHAEFATPEKVEGNGQGRGNSGIYFMGRYEVQVLDSYGNPTYFDGQCGAIYKQQPPMVNASRKPSVATGASVWRGDVVPAPSEKEEASNPRAPRNAAASGRVVGDRVEQQYAQG